MAIHCRKAIVAPRSALFALSLAIGMASCTPATQQIGSSPSSSPTGQSSPTASPQADRPAVVATTSLLCDVTRQIARDAIDLTCLMPPNQDPHVYKATPSDRRAIETADLVLYGGYSYEPELIRIVQATQTPAPKIAVYEAAVPDPLMGQPHEHDHGEAEAHDHDHAGETAGEAAGETDGEASIPDPHVWHSATNGTKIVEVVEAQLAKLLPDRAAEFQQNTATLTGELTEIDGWIKTQVAKVPAPARQLVTTHNAFQYFAKAYGFTIKGALDGLSTEEKPSAARLAELVDTVKNSGVKAIFSETTTNPKLIESVARSANVQVAEQPLFIEGPGGEGTSAPNYQAMLVENTCTVVNALGGNCDRSPVQP
ncbi:metal ABC transporter substrate-binding protein [Leptolyngbya ohadii]|uniref:metal ABC transporter substrate-binding protein n=1 Tax=Leptolyngbya ohadii TaxID=1962290 RepID=UPI000B59BB1B|nr:metal ABC transporter substrate-binding protein [Leptolyngbya ohadii]